MSSDKHTDSNELLMQELRALLLKKQSARIQALEDVLSNTDELDPLIAPIIEAHVERKIAFLKENVEVELKQPIETIIELKLEDSKEELLNILYPVLGKLIRKYIAHQFQQLKESIDQQIKQTRRMMSPKLVWMRLKNKLFGVKDSDLILSNLSPTEEEEFYVIQKNSGLLLGSYSRNKTMDQDLIAGMLTAIKSFVEDAFKQEGQELEMIEWQNYKIFIQNFYSYYIAVVISGPVDASYKDELSGRLLDFIEQELKGQQFKVVDDRIYQKISSKLKVSFGKG